MSMPCKLSRFYKFKNSEFLFNSIELQISVKKCKNQKSISLFDITPQVDDSIIFINCKGKNTLTKDLGWKLCTNFIESQSNLKIM